MALSVKHISQAGFFNSGKNFQNRVCLVHETIPLKPTTIVFLLQDLVIRYRVSIVLTLHGLKEGDCAWEKHFKYNPHCIYVLQNKGPKYVVDNNKKSN